MKNRIFLNRIGYFEAFLVFFAILLASFFIVKNSKAATFNEPVDINSALGVDLTSYLQQGAQVGLIDGSGGVLFANGTIVNASEGAVPVTLGDDLRVDGEIWRGPSKGISDNQALKISDYLLPTMNNMNDVGAPHHRWRDFYYAGTMYGEDAIIGRELWGGSRKGILSNDDPLFVSDSMYPTMDDINDLGSEDNRWQDLYLSGDVRQDISANGVAKGLVNVAGTGTDCRKTWTYNNGNVECDNYSTGAYSVILPFDVNDRYWQATPSTAGMGADFMVTTIVDPGNNRRILLSVSDADGNPANSDLMLIIY